jgi:hypothetical protein
MDRERYSAKTTLKWDLFLEKQSNFKVIYTRTTGCFLLN